MTQKQQIQLFETKKVRTVLDMAQVAAQRIDQMQDPELNFELETRDGR